jgi:hypothetical protein
MKPSPTRPGDGIVRSSADVPDPNVDAPMIQFRCPIPNCNTRLFDQALALGSVVEVKCKCNAILTIVQTTTGLLVALSEHVTYNRPRSRP